MSLCSLKPVTHDPSLLVVILATDNVGRQWWVVILTLLCQLTFTTSNVGPCVSSVSPHCRSPKW